MSRTSLSAFELLEELSQDGSGSVTVWRAQCTEATAHLRLTLFSPEMSASAGFRAAFRKDQTTLRQAPHDNVPVMLFWGEDDGQLFCVTEMPGGIPLSERLDAAEELSWDELTDIGWQIASVLQHAHNRGLSHGALTTSSVYVARGVRVSVTDFGVQRWLTSSKGTVSFAASAAQDLREVGQLLKAAFDRTLKSSDVSVAPDQVQAMNELITDLDQSRSTLTARDVQGRLGRVLLAVAGDSISIVDERNGQQLSRRSIVDELFDDEPTHSQVSPDDEFPHPTPSPLTRFVVVVAIVAAIVALVTFNRL
ncbi:MAG: protein kinase [Fuerstiella sp.]